MLERRLLKFFTVVLSVSGSHHIRKFLFIFLNFSHFSSRRQEDRQTGRRQEDRQTVRKAGGRKTDKKGDRYAGRQAGRETDR